MTLEQSPENNQNGAAWGTAQGAEHKPGKCRPESHPQHYTAANALLGLVQAKEPWAALDSALSHQTPREEKNKEEKRLKLTWKGDGYSRHTGQHILKAQGRSACQDASTVPGHFSSNRFWPPVSDSHCFSFSQGQVVALRPPDHIRRAVCHRCRAELLSNCIHPAGQ